LPIASHVTLLPGAGPRPGGDYFSAAAGGAGEPAALVAVAVEADGRPAADASLDAALPVSAAEVIAAYQQTGQPGEVAQTVARVGSAAVRVMFLGVGDRSARSLRRAGAELGRRLCSGQTAAAAATAAAVAAATVVADQDDDQVQAFTEGILLGSYTFSLKSGSLKSGSLKSGTGDPVAAAALVRLLVAGPRDRSAALRRARVIADAVALARDLANAPSAGKSPQWLADQAVSATREHGIGARVWTGAELSAGGFGGIVAVGSGSARPPVLIELTYAPADADSHVVLAGKGITFDSGGLSLKPNDAMRFMKTDMAGGAAVIAVMSALSRMNVRKRVTGLIPAAENMPSGSAYRPSDVITQFGGRTVEVLNTDAEGRLVLADALAYADAVLAPDQVVDIATLTGAARTALGSSHAALYSTSDALAQSLLAAGDASGDRLWRMPLARQYLETLESPVADLSQVARHDGQPGSIFAALFLREFAGERPWAHLDIAGAGRATSDDGELAKGATGFGTRLLLRWLSQD
jgi:leucyl aminopeptidase